MSVSSWRWISDTVAKDNESKVIDDDSCSQSSGPLPGSRGERKSKQLEGT